KSLRRLLREVTGDLGLAVTDHSESLRSRDDLVVEDDRELVLRAFEAVEPTGDLSELVGTLSVEDEVHRPLPGRRTGLGGPHAVGGVGDLRSLDLDGSEDVLHAAVGLTRDDRF